MRDKTVDKDMNNTSGLKTPWLEGRMGGAVAALFLLGILAVAAAPVAHAETDYAPRMDYTEWQDLMTAYNTYTATHPNIDPLSMTARNGVIIEYRHIINLRDEAKYDEDSGFMSVAPTGVYGADLPGLQLGVSCEVNGRTSITMKNTGKETIYLDPTTHPQKGLVLYGLRDNSNDGSPSTPFDQIMHRETLDPGQSVTGRVDLAQNLVFNTVMYSGGSPISWDSTVLSC